LEPPVSFFEVDFYLFFYYFYFRITFETDVHAFINSLAKVGLFFFHRVRLYGVRNSVQLRTLYAWVNHAIHKVHVGSQELSAGRH
jgi:hypothetical protein